MRIEKMLQIHPFEDACGSLNGVSEEVRKIAFYSYRIGLLLGLNIGLDAKVYFKNKNNRH